ncbi:MAG TPA: cytochrome c3 family protein [Pyrinomonadaceae bacterium]
MKLRTLTLALLLTAALAGVVRARVSPSAAAEPQRRRTAAQRRAPARARVDYTKFTHATPAHRKDSCDSCHRSPSDNWAQVRDKDVAFPDITDYPEHASCLSCHRQQFFRGARPAICTVCHTVVSPRSGARHPFANPPEPFARTPKARTKPSEFALNFPHDIHQDVMAAAPPRDDSGVRFVRAAFAQGPPKQAKANSCSVCHETYRPQPTPAPTRADAPAAAGAGLTVLPAGLLKTTPTGHASCFNCHWQEGGERPVSTDCAGCHKPLPAAAPRPAPAGKDADAQFAARAGFTDPNIVTKLLRRDSVIFAHEEERHREIDCATCHRNIPALSTLDDATLKVPILSCGAGTSCHIGAKPKKILNEEVDKKLADANFRCVKCHFNFGREQTPRSHLDAVGK